MPDNEQCHAIVTFYSEEGAAVDLRRLAVLASIVMAMLVAAMDTTIINTTMPVIAQELGNFELYAWTFASYMIFATVLSPVAGRLSDMFGRKKVFAAGIVLFLLGSLLCGSANSMVQLVIYRALQGIGAGVMNPFPAIIAGDLFPVEKRGKIQAIFTGMWGLSAVIAPLLGSLFVEYSTWRWIFYVNVPICLLSLVLLIPYKESYEPKPAAIDYGGALLFTAGVSLLLLTTVVEQGVLLYLLGAVALLALFYYYEKRYRSPIVPLGLLRNRPIAWLNVNGFIGNAALFGASTYLPLYLQDSGYTIFESGIAMLSMTAGWMVASVPAGKWIIRYGYRPLTIIGNAVLVASGAYFLLLSEGSGFWFVFFGAIPMGVAFGLLSTVAIIGSQQLVAPHEKGVSTSLQMFSRNIGTSIGVTLMGAMLADAANMLQGFQWMFYYGFAASLLALASAFMIRDKQPAAVGADARS